jgi:hypothetical protein
MNVCRFDIILSLIYDKLPPDYPTFLSAACRFPPSWTLFCFLFAPPFLTAPSFVSPSAFA